jgi:hypothetical protein
MRDTVWSILLTQIPIAVACVWVAWEVRGIRRALQRIGDALSSRRDADPDR